MANKVYLKYDEAMTAIKLLQTQIDDFECVLANIKKLYSRIPQSWSGEASKASVEKLKVLEKSAKTTLTDLKNKKKKIQLEVERIHIYDTTSTGGGSR